jgi:hypothetical protein
MDSGVGQIMELVDVVLVGAEAIVGVLFSFMYQIIELTSFIREWRHHQ